MLKLVVGVGIWVDHQASRNGRSSQLVNRREGYNVVQLGGLRKGVRIGATN